MIKLKAPANMYVLCAERINIVDQIMERNGKAYIDF